MKKTAQERLFFCKLWTLTEQRDVLAIVKSLKSRGLEWKNLTGGERMTNVGEIYVCKICGNAVEVVVAGAGRLVCCGQPMELVEDDE
jgi:desulfoferrodoxin-like iron-binding protein